MTLEKYRKAVEILDMMVRHEVSIKDLSIVLSESPTLEGSLFEIQKKIKGFLYPDPNIVEY